MDGSRARVPRNAGTGTLKQRAKAGGIGKGIWPVACARRLTQRRMVLHCPVIPQPRQALGDYSVCVNVFIFGIFVLNGQFRNSGATFPGCHSSAPPPAHLAAPCNLSTGRSLRGAPGPQQDSFLIKTRPRHANARQRRSGN